MPLLYDDPENHLDHRIGLSSLLKQQLTGMQLAPNAPRPEFERSAAFFVEVHGALRDYSARLPEGLRALVDAPADQRSTLHSAHRSAPVARHLVQLAHNHHTVEDDHYFPKFVQAMPTLANAIDLLEGDHLILDATLDQVATTMALVRKNPADLDALARALQPAEALQKLLQRHLADEEEIIMPVFALLA